MATLMDGSEMLVRANRAALHTDLFWRSVTLKLRRAYVVLVVLCWFSTASSLSEIKISYFCDSEIRVQVLNTAQFAEVYFLIQNFENHVTLAFCTLLQCFLK